MEDNLICPICDKEMKYSFSIDSMSFYMGKEDNVSGIHQYVCDSGHERILAKFSWGLRVNMPFVYLGDGCYVVTSDNTSCERAIARMRREYEENK